MILLDQAARPVVAHRGASGQYPENTLLAFERALDQGADALEFDVRLTADGVPVVLHDATLDRTTSGAGPLSAVTWERLREVDAGSGERVPSVAQVLERFPDTPLLIEVKEVPAALPLRLVLERWHAAGRVVLGAFQRAALRPFDAEPWRRAAGRTEIAAFLAAARLGLPRWPGRYRAFSVPERSGLLSIVNGSFIALAHRVGKPIHVWTVNDPAHAARLWAAGVSGIITNVPGQIRGAGS